MEDSHSEGGECMVQSEPGYTYGVCSNHLRQPLYCIAYAKGLRRPGSWSDSQLSALYLFACEVGNATEEDFSRIKLRVRELKVCAAAEGMFLDGRCQGTLLFRMGLQVWWANVSFN